MLHGIDVTLQQAEFVALTGPSGSGKSTLLNIIGLLERATRARWKSPASAPRRWTTPG